MKKFLAVFLDHASFELKCILLTLAFPLKHAWLHVKISFTILLVVVLISLVSALV